MRWLSARTAALLLRGDANSFPQLASKRLSGNIMCDYKAFEA